MKVDGIKIETGIPIPSRGSRVRGITAKLRQMNVGDSILLKLGEKSARFNIYTFARQAGIKITARSIGGGDLRVWRIE